jgi:hypothetical protein
MLKVFRKLIASLKGRTSKSFEHTYGEGQRDSEPDRANFATYTTFNTQTVPSNSVLNSLTFEQTRDMIADVKHEKKPQDIRIEKKPVEVVSEIVSAEPVLRLNDIDKQIKIVESRLAVLKRFKGQTSDEVSALRYLNARRYYEKAKKKGMFPWAVTTDTLVSALVAKYKLQNVGFGGYSKSVPVEATEELEKFGKAWEYVVDDEQHTPELRLITDYQGPEHKKDPILLASSPFGRWWYVLGAWDKEVEIVDQIIYHGK